MESIYHPEDRNDAVLLSLVVYLCLSEVPDGRNLLVRESEDLRSLKCLHVVDSVLESLLHVDDLFEGLKEDIRDHGDLVDLIYADAPSQKLSDSIHIVISELGDVLHELVAAHAVEFCKMEMAYTGLERSDGLEEALCQSSAYAHDLSGSLHLCSELVGSVRELVERESREFCNYIVKARLSAALAACYLDLVECHAYSDLGCYSCDRIAGSLGCERR